MRLKSEYFEMISDLANWSMELTIMTDWSKDGFSSKDFKSWFDSVSRFIKFLSRHKPSDLISSDSSQFDFSDLGLPPQKFKNCKKHDWD